MQNKMNFIKKIRDWWRCTLRHSRISHHEYISAQRNKEAIQTINVTEFNGRIYISYNNVPVVRVDDIKAKAPEILAQAREDFLEWRKTFNR